METKVICYRELADRLLDGGSIMMTREGINRVRRQAAECRCLKCGPCQSYWPIWY